jgi:hypothetical protein
MQFFGPIRWGGALDGADFVPAPVGLHCVYCMDPIYADEYGIIMPCVHDDGVVTRGAYHRECHIRCIVGSVSHQKRQCQCFGGKEDEESKFPSRRMSAIAAYTLFTEQRAWDVSEPTITKQIGS